MQKRVQDYGCGGDFLDDKAREVSLSLAGDEGKHQREREAFESLPLSERIARNVEKRLFSLLNVSYITPQEADFYKEGTSYALPDSRWGLVVSYFLLGLNYAPDIRELEDFNEFVSKLCEFEPRIFDDQETGEGLSPEEYKQRQILNAYSYTRTEAELRKIEAFVDGKRQRMRGKLLKLLPVFIAFSLVESKEDSSLCPNVHLRQRLESHGFSFDGDSLSEEDLQAIRETSREILDIMEGAYLNREAILRIEEYSHLQDEEGDFKEDYLYRDELDEILIEFEDFFSAFRYAVLRFYQDTTPQESIEALSYMYEKLKVGFTESLQGTRFYSLLDLDI